MTSEGEHARKRTEVLRGLLALADRRHELIDALWEAADEQEAIEAVQRVLDVNDLQARAVLDLQVRRLSASQMADIRILLDELSGHSLLGTRSSPAAG
jgi:DNA gyrase subunit A